MKIETEYDIGDTVRIREMWTAKIVAIQVDADNSISYKLSWIGDTAIQYDTISQSEMAIIGIVKINEEQCGAIAAQPGMKQQNYVMFGIGERK